jgi:hypothetical protein
LQSREATERLEREDELRKKILASDVSGEVGFPFFHLVPTLLLDPHGVGMHFLSPALLAKISVNG